MPDLLEQATEWRDKWKHTNLGGFVIFFNDAPYGWTHELNSPEAWAPGCVAINESGECWVAIGGDDYEGAQEWLSKNCDEPSSGTPAGTEYIYHYQEDGEVGYETGLYEAAQEYIESGYEIPESQVLTLYRGVSKEFSAKDFFLIDIESMTEQAYEEVGEHCEAWGQALSIKEAEITAHLAIAFQRFCDENNLSPSFWRVEDIQPVQVKIELDSDGDLATVDLVKADIKEYAGTKSELDYE